MFYILLGQGIPDAQSGRDYIVKKMSDEIHEIIRVLQLTTYDEDEWDADDLTVMKKCQVMPIVLTLPVRQGGCLRYFHRCNGQLIFTTGSLM